MGRRDEPPYPISPAASGEGPAVSELEMERAATRSEIENKRASNERGATAGMSVTRRAEVKRDSAWVGEFREMAALSAPLILTSIAQMAVNASTTMMVGHLGPESLSAAALATSIYSSFLVFGMGIVSAVAPMMANERGRDPRATEELRRTVRQGFWAAVAITVPIWTILWNVEPLLMLLGQTPESARRAAFYMHHLQWGLLPQLFYVALRSFLAVLGRPLWTLLAAAGAILVNIGLGLSLIHGRLGLPALGFAGAGIASACAGTTLFVGLALVVTIHRRFRRYHLFGRFWRADWARFFEVMRLGLPIAIALAFETTAFTAAMLMMGLIGATAVAAHAIAMQIGTLAYMVPTGIAQAATVRVGLARGARDTQWIGRAGWTAYGMALGASGLVALFVVFEPRLLASLFIDVDAPANAEVVALALTYLGFAALFLMTDSLQVVIAGMLRGLFDTRVPMLIAAFGYCFLGLPLGALLAFRLGFAGIGIWTGIVSSLGVVGLIMTVRWIRREKYGLVPRPPVSLSP
jgi:MATE family multidrug resistance protein